MFLLKLFGKLIKALSSGQSPAQLAGGFVLGMIVGLTPFWNLHNALVILIIILIRVNISMAIFSALLFGAIAYLFDPIFHAFGYWLLVDVQFLRGMWVWFVNQPVFALFNLNNTVVVGSLVISLILVIPMYFLSRGGVILYREKVHDRLQKLKVIQMVKKSWIYTVYNKISRYGD